MTVNTTLHFPPGFVWGTASAAHQVEGNNGNSQWCAFNDRPGAIWHGDRSGLACDWWADAERDFDLMQQFGMQAHRLSVEWSRIEPRPGEFDFAALDRYRAMLGGLRARGIEPMVCFHHFTNPLWLQERGSWEHAEVIERFAYFVRTACAALRDLCTQWMTINEPLIYVHHGYVVGLFPPAQANVVKAMRVYRNMLLAHGAAYHAVHAVQPEAQVGNAAAVRNFTPLRPSHWGDRAATALQRYLGEEVWFRALQDGRIRPPLGMGELHPALKGAFDWTGLNYYTTSVVRGTPNPLSVFGEMVNPEGAELSDSGRAGPYSWYAPDGLYDVCTAAARLGKPIYVTENGLPDADDDQRPRWLIGHLAALHRAIRDGADVRGYYHWTFVDNFEWAEGWGLRFGLVEMDPATQARRPRPSASLYRDIIRANAVTPEIVQRYAPELPAR